jgi:hypothetical protein
MFVAAAATEATPLAGTSRVLPRSLVGLDFLRLVGAVHIAYFHFDLAASTDGFRGWGETWVVFFFVLSGFGVAHSFAGSKGVDARPPSLWPSRETLVRRLVSVCARAGPTPDLKARRPQKVPRSAEPRTCASQTESIRCTHNTAVSPIHHPDSPKIRNATPSLE